MSLVVGERREVRKGSVKQPKSVGHLLVHNECVTTLQWRCEMSDQLLRVLSGECLMGQFWPPCICAFVVNESKTLPQQWSGSLVSHELVF